MTTKANFLKKTKLRKVSDYFSPVRPIAYIFDCAKINYLTELSLEQNKSYP